MIRIICFAFILASSLFAVLCSLSTSYRRHLLQQEASEKEEEEEKPIREEALATLRVAHKRPSSFHSFFVDHLRNTRGHLLARRKQRERT